MINSINSINEKEQKLLLKALDKVKKERADEKKKSFEKLFKKFSEVPSLADALNSLTVAELKEVKRLWDVQALSTAKKGELVEKISEAMIQGIENGMKYFDSERVDGFEAYSGIVVTEKLFSGMNIVTYFRKLGLLFPGVIDGNKIIVLPKELKDKYDEIKEKKVYRDLIKKNDDILELTRGYLHIYGVLSLERCIELIKEKLGYEVSYEWFFGLLIQRFAYTAMEFSICGEYLCHVDVYDHMELLEKGKTSEYPYRDFSAEEIKAFGRFDYGTDCASRRSFKELILDAYNMDMADAEEIAAACEYAMKNEKDVQFIMEYLGHNLIMNDVDIYAKILKSLVELKDDTIHWGLKGFTPKELENAKSKNKNLNGKIGRNDPCTCGSGKKYKKCCGKN